MPDSLWRQAWKVPVMVGVAIVCGVLLGLDFADAIDLGYPIRPLIIVLFVFCGALAVFGLYVLAFARKR